MMGREIIDNPVKVVFDEVCNPVRYRSSHAEMDEHRRISGVLRGIPSLLKRLIYNVDRFHPLT
jgi:hypothetical protein